jgi:hypothetical protein
MAALFVVDNIGVEAFCKFFKETYAFDSRARVRASHFHNDCREKFGIRFPEFGPKDASLLLLALVMKNPMTKRNDGFLMYCGFYRLRECVNVTGSIRCRCSLHYVTADMDAPLVKPPSPSLSDSESSDEEEARSISSEDDESSTDYITYFTD